MPARLQGIPTGLSGRLLGTPVTCKVRLLAGCPIKSSFKTGVPTQPQALWEAGELLTQGHFSEGYLRHPKPSWGPAGGDGVWGHRAYRKSPAAAGERLWPCSCHRQRSLEKGWSSVLSSSGKPS